MRRQITFMLMICLLGWSLAGCGYLNRGGSNQDQETSQQEVVLYFADDQAMYLQAEKRTITVDADSSSLPLKEIINELIKGPQDQSLSATIPAETKLLSAEVKDSVAYIDFSEEIRTKHWGGSAGETMTIMSLVNTLTEYEAIQGVQILIKGEKQDSLAGHWSIDKPIERDESLIKR